jgi:hypothetical protein
MSSSTEKKGSAYQRHAYHPQYALQSLLWHAQCLDESQSENDIISQLQIQNSYLYIFRNRNSSITSLSLIQSLFHILTIPFLTFQIKDISTWELRKKLSTRKNLALQPSSAAPRGRMHLTTPLRSTPLRDMSVSLIGQRSKHRLCHPE